MVTEELPFPDVSTRRESLCRTQVWLLAAEPGQEAGIRRSLNPRHQRHPFQNVFVEATEGAETISRGDVFLVRTSTDHFDVYAPAGIGKGDQIALKEEVERLDRWIDAEDQPVRYIDELILLTFSPGRLGAAPRSVRTGLEDLLQKLLDQRVRQNPFHVLNVCLNAKEMVGADAHPALLGLLERVLGDALFESMETKAIEPATDATPAYSDAIASLRQAGLSGQASSAAKMLRMARRHTARAAQPWLPHLPSPSQVTPRRSRIGFAARQLYGCRLTTRLQSLRPEVLDAPLHHSFVGSVELSSDVLLRCIGSARSRELRATVKANLEAAEPRLYAVLDDQFLSLLGLAGTCASSDELCLIVPRASGVHFSPPRGRIQLGKWAEFSINGDIGKRLDYRVDFLTADTSLAIVGAAKMLEAAAA